MAPQRGNQSELPVMIQDALLLFAVNGQKFAAEFPTRFETVAFVFLAV